MPDKGLKKSNEWYTPISVIKAVRAVLGSIELDPASCEAANKTVGAARYFTEVDNGLLKEWKARSVWLNPPYSHTTRTCGMQWGDTPKSLMLLWIAKLIEEYRAGHIGEAILLTKADPKQTWFWPLWEFPICFARDRVYFNRPGLEPSRMMFGTCFAYFGPNEAKFIEVFSAFGAVVKRVEGTEETGGTTNAMVDSSLVNQEIPNSNRFAGREGHTPRWIILHGTAGGTSAVGIANYFASTQGSANPVSAHYVIGTDGTIVQCNSESDGAWANGATSAGCDPWWLSGINPNDLTISIEHCKASTDNSDALTPAQQTSSFKLVADICQRWQISMQPADGNGGITGHYSIDPVNRSRCPGTYPWGELWTFLNSGGSTSMIPAGWSDDGATLTAPNGHKVVLGFRDYILAHQWDPGNVPLEKEYDINPVEDYYSQTPPDGTRQMFNYCELGYTITRGVYVVGIGNELSGCRADRDQAKSALAAAQAQIAALQSQIDGNVVIQDAKALFAAIGKLKADAGA